MRILSTLNVTNRELKIQIKDIKDTNAHCCEYAALSRYLTRENARISRL